GPADSAGPALITQRYRWALPEHGMCPGAGCWRGPPAAVMDRWHAVSPAHNAAHTWSGTCGRGRRRAVPGQEGRAGPGGHAAPARARPILGPAAPNLEACLNL